MPTMFVTDHTIPAWLIASLGLHPGELLICRSSPHMSWEIGRISDSGALHLVPYNPSAPADEQLSSYSGDVVALTDSPTGHVSDSAHRVSNRPIIIELKSSLSSLDDPARQGEYCIGNAAVTALIKSLSTDERFHAWVVTRQLGHPIGGNDAEVMAELHRRREEMIPALIGAETTIIGYRRQLADWQQNPSAFLDQPRRRYTGGIAPTPTGVTIDFGLTEPIQAAKLALSRLIAVGKADLLMVDNPTLQRAAATAAF